MNIRKTLEEMPTNQVLLKMCIDQTLKNKGIKPHQKPKSKFIANQALNTSEMKRETDNHQINSVIINPSVLKEKINTSIDYHDT
jgi:hypothetical protein